MRLRRNWLWFCPKPKMIVLKANVAIAGLGSRKIIWKCVFFKIKDDPSFPSMTNTVKCQKWSHISQFSCLEKRKSVSMKLTDETYSFSNYRLFKRLMENRIKMKRTISRNQLASFLSVIGNIYYINVLLLYLYVKSSIKNVINNKVKL